MKIKVICIGKTGKDFLVNGEHEYMNRLKHYAKVEKVELPDIKNARKLSQDQVKSEEGKAIIKMIDSSDQVFLLDEKGKQYSSEVFAEFLQKRFNQGGKCLVFVIGGAYGFSEELYQRAQGKLSLSAMTFSHQMIRMIFFEQLYRAMTIQRGEPYHHS
jgi:23S rRNA (pseudouridine1915-N3)-methyltransferase